MRITLSAPDANGLKVIEEIPDHKLCHIEGRNGIGKTLSIRLLELISGTQPYSTLPHAWSSLKEQLGPATIVFTGLAEGEIEVLLTPDEWPDEPLLDIEKLGTARLKGKSVPMERVRKLVHVHRIAGDETLSETLALELAEQAAQARQLDADVAPTIDAWDNELQDLAELVENISADHLKRLLRDQALCKKRANEVDEDSRTTATDIEATAAALAGIQRMQERHEKLDGLLDALDAAAAQLAAQEQKVDALAAVMAELSAERDLDAIESELYRWGNRSRYRAKALSKALLAERQMLVALGLDERPTEAERANLHGDAEVEAAELQAQLNSLDSIGGLKSLLAAIDRTFEEAPDAVDDQIVIREPAEVTADALRSGVHDRQEELEGVPRPGDVEELFRHQRAASLRAARLVLLADLISRSDKKLKLLTDATEMISELWDRVEGSAALRPVSDQLREASDIRAARALAVVDAAEALVQLLDTGPVDTSSVLPIPSEDEVAEATPDDTSSDPSFDDPGTAADEAGKPAPPENPCDRVRWEAIAAELDRAAAEALRAFEGAPGEDRSQSDELDLVVEALTQRNERLAADIRELEEEAAIARRNLRAAQHAVKVYAERCARSIEAVETDDRWKRYRPGLTSLIGDIDRDEIKQVSEALGGVGAFISEIRSHMIAVRGGLNQVAFWLDAESVKLTGRGDVSQTVASALESFELSRLQRKRIREWAESQLAELVGSVALRNELFDGAPAVTVDLRRATVSWESPADGRVRQRPFEAFSSGEQVFAYTKAKLELLREHPPDAAHIVVVLDEFGAFVARDRFGQLMQFVAEDALGSVAEQIVVILPLADDYLLDSNAEELVRASGTDQGGAYLDRIAQLDERQYFAIPVSAS